MKSQVYKKHKLSDIISNFQNTSFPQSVCFGASSAIDEYGGNCISNIHCPGYMVFETDDVNVEIYKRLLVTMIRP